MSDDDIQPRTVVDVSTGRPILFAPRRQGRPMHTGENAGKKPCPFCHGNEALTPPELDIARDPDEPSGWLARAFANKYPASEHHEVIAEGRRHDEHPCDLDATTWRAALDVWRRRMQAIEAHDGVACAFLFKNVGARAGASIAHNHSQVLGLDALPPRIALERAQQRELGRCPWCATLADAREQGRLIHENDAFAIVAPEPPKMPYESWLLPKRCESDYYATDFELLADALHAWFTALGNGLDRAACNFWLHRVPVAQLRAGETFHWHFELQPRTGQLAGLELGGDMYINSVPAQRTAERLRQGLRDA